MVLVDVLDLKKAFQRIESDKHDDAMPDVVGYRDYKKSLDENLDLLKQKLASPDQYVCARASMIDIPKSNFTLRPGVVPHIEDRIVYQAIVDLLAPHFQQEAFVLSNRLAGNDSNRMFVPGVELWLQFQDRTRFLCTQFSHVVQTDLTAYFDHISHQLLANRITDLFSNKVDKKILDDVKKILEKKLLFRWKQGVANYGIPQINDASSFLGNIYMDELDKWFVARGYVALRYVDDIRIFTKSEAEARSALAELIIKLREMGLYVNSGKTRIKTVQKVLEETNRGAGVMAEIEGGIESRNPQMIEGAAQLLQEFFLELVGDPSIYDDRLFRFCINRFKRLKVTGLCDGINNRIVDEVLCRLVTMPDSTGIFVDFLSLFPMDEYLQKFVLDFLEGPYNIYPWQEMQLLELLIRSNISPALAVRVQQFACSIILRNSHPVSRAKAIILRGKNGSYADRRDLRSFYQQEMSGYTRRSIIVAIQEMQRGERDNFYKSIYQDSRDTANIVGYIQALPEPKYFYFSPPTPYDVDFPDPDSDDIYDLGSEFFS